KSLLFLATGSVLHATKERSLGKLGGLIHRMPWVAWLALVGTLAAAGIPPLNGFVSEWLLLQAFLFTPSLPQSFINMLVPLAAADAGRAPALSRTRPPRAAVGLRIPAADAAHAGHCRRLRAADTPDLRAVLPHGAPPAVAVRSRSPLLGQGRRPLLARALSAHSAGGGAPGADRGNDPAGPDLDLSHVQLLYVAGVAVRRAM